MAPIPRRLGVWSLGFARHKHARRILELAGWTVVPGWTACDAIGVWGAGAVADRAHRAAKRRNLPLVYIEDAPLRSVSPDRYGPVHGLIIDEQGLYLDADASSTLTGLFNSPGYDRDRAEAAMAMLTHVRLSKYNDATRPAKQLPPDGFVLVVDQVPGDASIRLGRADGASFARMLDAAIAENPDAQIVIKRHPRASQDEALAHFNSVPKGVSVLADSFNPHDVLAAASQVYCVTSQLGFEAICAGHVPHVFGAPFYAGWGLSKDRVGVTRKQVLEASGLFAKTMLDYPVWYDVGRDELCDFETVVENLAAERKHHPLAANAPVATGMRRWKQRHMRAFLGHCRFVADQGDAVRCAVDQSRPLAVWASAASPQLDTASIQEAPPVLRVEDGFLRSNGLGAALIRPLSLCLDKTGIYYDPRRPSDLETLISAAVHLPNHAVQRAAKLRAAICAAGVSKYNIGGQTDLPSTSRTRVLVVGQVEDDASVLAATTDIATNSALLEAARTAHPDAQIVYKPHPDVEAGLRRGAMTAEAADLIWSDCDPIAAILASDHIWTMSSLLGFEALLHGRPVTCTGMPFYAGWGLTIDTMSPPQRRGAKVTLDGLVHAALIDYPHYVDPMTSKPCSPELAVQRLAAGAANQGGAKSAFWRRFGSMLRSR